VRKIFGFVVLQGALARALDQAIRPDPYSWVTMHTNATRELVILILQFLDDVKLSKTAHMLEQESACYFNVKYFEEQVLTGEWDEVEHYLSCFTIIEDNIFTMKMFFEIRKQKYFEALDRQDRPKAVQILVNDLKFINSYNQNTYKELTQLIPLENIRECDQLSKYGDTTSTRKHTLLVLRKLIEKNPELRNKLAFPHLQDSRLMNIINQSLNWQHKHCKHGRSNLYVKTLFVDHVCEPQTPTNNSLVEMTAKEAPFLSIATHAPFQHGVAPSCSNNLSPTECTENPNPPVPRAVLDDDTVSLFPSQNAGLLKRSRTPPSSNTGIDYPYVNSKHVVKRSRIVLADKVTYTGPTHPPNTYSQDDLPTKVAISLNQGSEVISMYSLDDLPMKVARSLNQGVEVTNMDFHPQQHTFLLVGTSTGDIGIWEVGSGKKSDQMNFSFWDVSYSTMKMQAARVVDQPPVSVNRCIWSPDGARVGVAFSKDIIQTYSYIGDGKLRPHLETNAHIGGVNDIAFGCRDEQIFIITCGDDKSIKVWDFVTGHRRYIFEGHEAPVYCILTKLKENTQFIISTSIDGKIKCWLYDRTGSIFDCGPPLECSIALVYSADGSRLFSCVTRKGGSSYLAEWNESDGGIKRIYSGFEKHPFEFGKMKFDTTRNRFLAAGDDRQIKFWDMDNVHISTTTDFEEGCLEASPRIRFNKEGSLLAVTTKNNGIKILANADGLRLLHIKKNGIFEGTRVQPEALVTKASIRSPVAFLNATSPFSDTEEHLERVLPTVSMNSADNNRPADVKQRLQDEDANMLKNRKLEEVSDAFRCRSYRLSDPNSKGKILQLLYTKSGSDVLALDSNAVHKLWIWTCNERNPTAKATTPTPTRFNQSTSESTTHDLCYRDREKAIACMLLSNNDSYILSASGGEVSLLRMKSLKILKTWSSPPPGATSVAFHPKDNNIIAFGLEDSKIIICYIKFEEKKVLEGHQQKITGLAFSEALNVLISCGADAQLCAWSMNGWKKQREKSIYSQEGRLPSPVEVTKIQFHKDQVRLLLVRQSQIAIYDASRLEQLCHWETQDSEAPPISSATYSCDSQLIYASFCDGSIGIFDADALRRRFRIPPSAFLPPEKCSGIVYPLTIAAHPLVPNHFAIGLTDGGVHLIEISNP
ncbi:hypothetical protein KI387_004894, partial [Taxus chinensis]